MDLPEYWPLPGLRLRIGRLELRLPDAADQTALAALAEAGVHDPEVQPFAVAWTDAEPAERAISTMRYHWSCWGSWQPSRWTLNLVAVLDGVVCGIRRQRRVASRVAQAWLRRRRNRAADGARQTAGAASVAAGPVVLAGAQDDRRDNLRH
jgi:hypothetical protein